jgi:uncharacterized membrane protein (DUF485 family)
MESFGNACFKKMRDSFLVTCAIVLIGWYSGYMEEYLKSFEKQWYYVTDTYIYLNQNSIL